MGAEIITGKSRQARVMIALSFARSAQRLRAAIILRGEVIAQEMPARAFARGICAWDVVAAFSHRAHKWTAICTGPNTGQARDEHRLDQTALDRRRPAGRGRGDGGGRAGRGEVVRGSTGRL